MAHKPTAQTRKHVAMWAGTGISQKAIAERLKINSNTLRRHYKEELEIGLDLTTAFVQTKLMRLINAGNLGAIALYLKCRAGWREGQEIKFEDTTPGVPARNFIEKLRASMTAEQWKVFSPLFRQVLKEESKDGNSGTDD